MSSDSVPTPTPAPDSVDSTYVPAAVPTPAPAPAAAEVVSVAIDFTNKSELIKFALKTVAQAEILADRSDEDKAKFVVEEVKKAVRESSSLSEDQKKEVLVWCDAALPYVLEGVKIAKAEFKKMALTALVDVKKCCPSWFAKKAVAPTA